MFYPDFLNRFRLDLRKRVLAHFPELKFGQGFDSKIFYLCSLVLQFLVLQSSIKKNSSKLK
jgi:hypothetical protein